MRLIFLGTGSAFTVGANNYQSNMLLENQDGKRLLIDCGSDARHALYEIGLSSHDIQDVYISHLHADHVGGLEWLAFTTKFSANRQKICLHLNETLVEPLWDHVLSEGLCCISGEKPTLTSFFDVDPVPSNGYFEWQGVKCHLVQTIHTVNDYIIKPSYGLWLELSPDFFVFITTDTQLAPNQIHHLYQKANIIFQDCETTPNKSGVHAHYQDLIHLDPQIKKKMWLYHYAPGELPNAEEDGFKGFVQKGQAFDFSSVI